MQSWGKNSNISIRQSYLFQKKYDLIWKTKENRMPQNLRRNKYQTWHQSWKMIKVLGQTKQYLRWWNKAQKSFRISLLEFWSPHCVIRITLRYSVEAIFIKTCIETSIKTLSKPLSKPPESWCKLKCETYDVTLNAEENHFDVYGE